MTKSNLLTIAIWTTLLALVLPLSSSAQDATAPTTYLEVDCMKSTSPDYTDVESEIWKPMHQALIDAGQKNAWALYWVRFGDRSECDYYTVNVFVGEEQLNSAVSYAEIFAKVHPNKDLGEAMARTERSRQMVRSELWTMVDAVPPKDFSYITVNQFMADDPEAYVKLEREVYMPVHKASTDAGLRAGWALYQLWQPGGTSVPYNFGAVDFRTKLGPEGADAVWAKVHPNADIAAITAKTLKARSVYNSATWAVVDRTNPAAAK